MCAGRVVAVVDGDINGHCRVAFRCRTGLRRRPAKRSTTDFVGVVSWVYWVWRFMAGSFVGRWPPSPRRKNGAPDRRSIVSIPIVETPASEVGNWLSSLALSSARAWSYRAHSVQVGRLYRSAVGEPYAPFACGRWSVSAWAVVLFVAIASTRPWSRARGWGITSD